jgi:hypothetical protein
MEDTSLKDRRSGDERRGGGDRRKRRSRRKYKRLKVSRRIDFEFEEKSLFGFTRDLGARGAFLRTSTVVPGVFGGTEVPAVSKWVTKVFLKIRDLRSLRSLNSSFSYNEKDFRGTRVEKTTGLGLLVVHICITVLKN